MGPQFTRSLVEILQSTLQRLEETSDFRQDDPAVIELKKHIVQTIAELEIVKTAHASESEADAKEPFVPEDPAATIEVGPIVWTERDAGVVEPAAAATGSQESSISEPPSTEPTLANNGTTTST